MRVASYHIISSGKLRRGQAHAKGLHIDLPATAQRGLEAHETTRAALAPVARLLALVPVPGCWLAWAVFASGTVVAGYRGSPIMPTPAKLTKDKAAAVALRPETVEFFARVKALLGQRQESERLYAELCAAAPEAARRLETLSVEGDTERKQTTKTVDGERV